MGGQPRRRGDPLRHGGYVCRWRFERRLGELSCDAALIATKFPATMWATADDLPRQLADSLARLRRESVDVYQHHSLPGGWTSPA